MHARLFLLMLALAATGCPPANDDDSASNDDDATSDDDDATSVDDDATGDDDDATGDDDDATGDDDDSTAPPEGSWTLTGSLTLPSSGFEVPTGDARIGLSNMSASFEVMGGAWSEPVGALADGLSYSITLPPDVPAAHLTTDGDYSRALYGFGVYIEDDADDAPSGGDIFVAGSRTLLIFVTEDSVVSASSAALGITNGWNHFAYNWGGAGANTSTPITGDINVDLTANLLPTADRETLPLTWEDYTLGVPRNMAMVHEASVPSGPVQLDPYMHDSAFTPADPVLTHAWDFVDMATPVPADGNLEVVQGRFAFAKYVAIYYGDDAGNQLYEPPTDEVCGHSYYGGNGINSWGALYIKALDFTAHAGWFSEQPIGWTGMNHGSQIVGGQPSMWTALGAWERYVWINNFGCD